MDEKEKASDITKISVLSIIIVLTAFNIFWICKSGNKIDSYTEYIENLSKPPIFNLTYIKDYGCEDCFNIDLVEKEIERVQGIVGDKKVVEFSSDEAKKLIEQYKIKRIPTVIIDGELKKRAELEALWPQIGRIVDGSFVLDDIQPPYFDIEQGNMRGEFSTIFLVDQNCKECYDVTLHQNALEGLSMTSSNHSLVDVKTDKGRKYVKDYKIDKIPTVILIGDLEVYEPLDQVWPQVGTIERDGAYIFRNLELMGTHKDLKTGRLVKISKP